MGIAHLAGREEAYHQPIRKSTAYPLSRVCVVPLVALSHVPPDPTSRFALLIPLIVILVHLVELAGVPLQPRPLAQKGSLP